MAWLTHVIWNKEEKRLRTLWRLLGQLLIAFPLLLILGSVAGFFVFGLLVNTGGLGVEQMSDPHLVRSAIMRDPLLLMITYLGAVPAVVISIWLAGRYLDHRPLADFGFQLNRDWWIDFCFGLGLGAVLMLLVFIAEWSLGWIEITGTFVNRYPRVGFVPSLIIPLLIFLMVGFYEELFSRGYQLTNLAEGLSGKEMGPREAILIASFISSVIFGLLHASNPNATRFSTLNIAVAGLMLALGYILTGQLAIPVGLHITWNFFQGNVFGFPVSGGNFRSATLIDIQQMGPEWITGGAFGPEGGLLGLIAMVLGMGMILIWVKQRVGQITLYLPLVDPPHLSHGQDE